MFLTYSELLNSLDSGAVTKITINNRRLNKANFETSILMPIQGDFRDEYRGEYNQMLLDKATGANGIMQEKYITVSVVKKDVEEARAYFARVGADLISHFAALGSKCVELDATERLRILHDFYRQGEESEFVFNAREMMKRGHSFKDYICPDGIEKNSDYLKLGGKFCRVLFLKDYASYIKDNMVTELTDFNRNLMFSIDIVPVPTDEAVREVENRLLGVETNITNWQRRQNANNNFSAVVPYDMELQRKESKEFLDDLTTRDQRMMFAVMTLAITADTKEQLDSDTEAVLSVARKHMCQLAVLKFQQLDGLNTALPIGVRKINAFRTLTTESLAVFIPFKVQEIQDKGGIYFGENAISHNLILCNKANLLNQSAFYLGVPGAGKSFAVKELIAFLMLHPDYADDDILICDPEGEFGALVKTLGREKATVAHLVAGGKDRLNAMYMVEGYGENNPIVEKSQFVMSLIEQIDKRGVGPQHKSIIDRCTALVYPEAEKAGRAATLCDLRRKLLEQPEDKAKEIALSLELYTTGSLDIFGRESTVDLSKPYVVFDIHGLGEQLKPAGSLVITDTILNRVTLNWKRGKRTHVFIDEFHVMFENEQSGIFFNSAWRQFRKRGAYPTAITQNVEYLLDSVQASTMLSNSEFLVMLSQAASDREKLAKLLNISNSRFIGFNTQEAPFNDAAVRQAVAYAIDKETISDSVFSGLETASEQLLDTSLPYCDVEATTYSYNADKAKELLESAGWVDSDGDGIREKDGAKLSVTLDYITNQGTMDDAALVIAQELGEVGFEVTPRGSDNMTWFTQVSTDFDFSLHTTYGGYYDPFLTMTNMNPEMMSDPILWQVALTMENGTDTIKELDSTADLDRVQEIYNVVLTFTADQAVLVPFTSAHQYAAFNSDKIESFSFGSDQLFIEIANVKAK